MKPKRTVFATFIEGGRLNRVNFFGRRPSKRKVIRVLHGMSPTSIVIVIFENNVFYDSILKKERGNPWDKGNKDQYDILMYLTEGFTDKYTNITVGRRRYNVERIPSNSRA